MVKAKLVPLKRLQKKADDLFSRFVRDRDTVNGLYIQTEEGLSIPCGYCFTCGKITPTEGVQTGDAGHFVKRSVHGLRYHERNVHLQCTKCNHFLGGNEGWYAVNLDKKYGVGTAEKLKALESTYRGDGNKPNKRADLERVINDYKGRV